MLPSSAIICIVILGAAALVLVGYALHRTFAMKTSNGSWEKVFNKRSTEQDQYMVDQRMAYRNDVIADARHARYQQQHQKHASNISSIPV